MPVGIQANLMCYYLCVANESVTVHDTVALRGDLDSILKILYHKDLRNVRTASRPST